MSANGTSILGQGALMRIKGKEKEKGCTEPLYGKKAKCVIKIVPQEEKCKSFEMDKRCVKSRN
jgi:hypothetical protein